MVSLTDKIMGLIFGFYLIIYALVPNITTWADAMSCVDAVDYGWAVGLIFLIVIFGLVKSGAFNNKNVKLG